MDLRVLRYFVAIAHGGSVTRASLQLGIAQPALSRHLRNLERDLGASLLVRHRRGVTLTQAGKVLLDQATDLLRRHAELSEVVNRAAGVATGRLAIGFPGSLGSMLLPAALARFATLCPLVQVQRIPPAWTAYRYCLV